MTFMNLGPPKMTMKAPQRGYHQGQWNSLQPLEPPTSCEVLCYWWAPIRPQQAREGIELSLKMVILSHEKWDVP